MAEPVTEVRSGWGMSAERALRRLATTTAAGALLGLLVGGAGGRLAMGLLAILNPRATGVTSDDGFRIGQFTVSGTLNLLIVATVIGALGGGIYLVLRNLMIGPRWLQVLSISAGPAVVVGSMLVHVDGVDFTLLRPPLLAIAMFVAIPAVYAALLTLLAERWLEPDNWFTKGPRILAMAPLLVWLPIAPLLAALAVGWLLTEWSSQLRRPPTAQMLSVTHWVARIALAALFAVSLFTLVRNTALLMD